MQIIFSWTSKQTDRRLGHVLTAVAELKRMFEDLQAEVLNIKAADVAMRRVLAEIKAKLDSFRVNSNLTPADAAKLGSIITAIHEEAADTVAAALANTDAPNQPGSPGDPPVAAAPPPSEPPPAPVADAPPAPVDAPAP